MQIVVIAKEPVAGRVKTRLCPPFSPAQAAELAAAALADTLATVAATPARRRVLVLDGAPGPWLPKGFDVVAQRGEGLADRLGAAVADVAAEDRGPLVLVGMDTPQLSPALLLDAGGRLVAPTARGRGRAVLGLADDGGWWLLGLSHADPRVFAGVPMSTARTGVLQARQLRRRGFALDLVDRLRDVDTVADARHVARQVPSSRFARRLADLGCDAAVPA